MIVNKLVTTQSPLTIVVEACSAHPWLVSDCVTKICSSTQQRKFHFLTIKMTKNETRNGLMFYTKLLFCLEKWFCIKHQFISSYVFCHFFILKKCDIDLFLLLSWPADIGYTVNDKSLTGTTGMSFNYYGDQFVYKTIIFLRDSRYALL